MTARGEVCELCYYYQKSEKYSDRGICHRYPPETQRWGSDGGDINVWTTYNYTDVDYWCGEFKEKDVEKT